MTLDCETLGLESFVFSRAKSGPGFRQCQLCWLPFSQRGIQSMIRHLGFEQRHFCTSNNTLTVSWTQMSCFVWASELRKLKQAWPTVSPWKYHPRLSTVKLMRKEAMGVGVKISSLWKDCSEETIFVPFGSSGITAGCRRWHNFAGNLLVSSVLRSSSTPHPLPTKCLLFSCHFFYFHLSFRSKAYPCL